MKKADVTDVKAAFHYALDRLVTHPHAVFEIQQKLTRKGFTKGVAESVLATLLSEGLLNDDALAMQLADEAIRVRKRGPMWVHVSLTKKHVDDGLIQKALRMFTPAIEQEVAMVAAKSWVKKQVRLDSRAKEKMARFLVGRGFGPTATWDTVKRLGQMFGQDDENFEDGFQAHVKADAFRE